MNKRNKINKHKGSYQYSLNHALSAIYDGIYIEVDGQSYEYDKQRNELHIKDWCTDSIYRPKFNGIFCNPFAELVSKTYDDGEEYLSEHWLFQDGD